MTDRDRRSRDGWTPAARTVALAVRRQRRDEHNRIAGPVIRTCRDAGLSWRATARELSAATIPLPQGAQRGRTEGGEFQSDLMARWEARQVIRIARRLGIE